MKVGQRWVKVPWNKAKRIACIALETLTGRIFFSLRLVKKSTRNKREEMIMKILKDFINEMQIENLTVDNINKYLKLYGLKPIQK